MASAQLQDFSESLLERSAAAWFVVAVFGQWLFLSYVLVFYGGTWLVGEVDRWNSAIPNGIVSGDYLGNLAIGFHLLLAIAILGVGPLQLVPRIRARYPRFHRWSGRVYIVSACITGTIGFFIVWFRGAAGDVFQHLGISLDAVLIVVFSIFAYVHARRRNLWVHRQWALRLFVVTSAVWFYRVGLMAWVTLTGGAGINFEDFSGPFLMFWAFGQYLLPLAVLEGYFYVQDVGESASQLVVAMFVGMFSVITVIGIFAAASALWLPRVSGLFV